MSLEKKGEIDGSWQREYIRKGCGGWDTQWGGGGGLGEVKKKKKNKPTKNYAFFSN